MHDKDVIAGEIHYYYSGKIEGKEIWWVGDQDAHRTNPKEHPGRYFHRMSNGSFRESKHVLHVVQYGY